MKTYSWHCFVKNNFTNLFLRMAMLAFLISCSDDTTNLDGPGSNDASAGLKANINSTSEYSDYDIKVDVSTDGSEWEYTITKRAASGTTGKTPKDISHLIINLQNCIADPDQSATFSDILFATVNGRPANFVSSEGNGTGCNPQAITTNFVKIDDISSASAWVIIIKYDRGYQKVLTNGWIKAGSSCTMGEIEGPGCPITDQCSYGQGRFFGDGYDNNGSIAQWPLVNNTPTLAIGGKNYSPAETNALWDANTGQGQSDEMKAFFQLGALYLSQVTPAELTNEIATIENYFLALPKVVVSTCTKQAGPNTQTYDCINLPDNSTVSEAADAIGTWIDANKCNHLN